MAPLAPDCDRGGVVAWWSFAGKGLRVVWLFGGYLVRGGNGLVVVILV